METSFVQKGGEDDEPSTVHRVSKTCRQYEEGTYPYKKKHIWKEYPANKWGVNKDKSLNDAGELILCTIDEFEEALEFNDDDLIDGIIFGGDGDNLNKNVGFTYMIIVLCYIMH